MNVEPRSRKRTVRTRTRSAPTQVVDQQLEQVLSDALSRAGVLMREQLAHATELDTLKTRIEGLMGKLGVTTEQNNVARAYFKQVNAKSSTTYDLAAIFDLLEEDQFLECVRISAADVKKHLNGKQLEGVSTKVDGVNAPPKFLVELRTEKK
jgi:hypothetical protein